MFLTLLGFLPLTPSHSRPDFFLFHLTLCVFTSGGLVKGGSPTGKWRRDVSRGELVVFFLTLWVNSC